MTPERQCRGKDKTRLENSLQGSLQNTKVSKTCVSQNEKKKDSRSIEIGRDGEDKRLQGPI